MSDERFLDLAPAAQKLVLFKVRKHPDEWEEILDRHSQTGTSMSHDAEHEPRSGESFDSEYENWSNITSSTPYSA